MDPNSGKGSGDVVNNPDIKEGMKNAPGVDAILHLINTLAAYAILGCLGALILSVLLIVIGPRLGLHQAGTVGKTGVIASIVVAFVIGIAGTIINFAYNA